MQDRIKPGELRSKSFVLPLIMVTSLFFMRGFAISMLDVLNKLFQDGLNVAPRVPLAWYAFVALVAIIVVMTNGGVLSLCAFMFPTIFSLGIQHLGYGTKRADSYMIMNIVGGAAIPPLMGVIADSYHILLALRCLLFPIPLFFYTH